MLNKKKQLQVEDLSIDGKKTMLDALRLMDRKDRKLLIVFQSNKYFGILSAGDIQRAIIGNKPLDTPINVILRKNIRVAHESDDFESIKQLMLNFRTEFMPVLNDAGDLVDVHFWENIFPTGEPELTQIDLPVVIMAGGKGTRLKPFSNILPKPLFPLGEKTIIEMIMDKFQKVGCNRFLFSVNYKHEFIRTYFNQPEIAPYNIRYFKEDQPLGTAGSLNLIKDEISETFFVSNCDILIDADYTEMLDYHREQHNEISMVISLKRIEIPYGTVETGAGGQVFSLKEKPELTYMINTGLYLLEPHLLHEIPKNKFYHMTDLIECVRNRGGKVGAFPISEKSWCDIGEWATYHNTLGVLGITHQNFP